MADVPIAYTPLPVHTGFHQTQAREKWGVGAVGSGKTLSLCGDLLYFHLNQQGSRLMLTRQTAAALRDTTETELVNMMAMPPEDIDYSGPTYYDLCTVRKGGGHIEKIITPDGSEIILRGLDKWSRRMGLNLAYIGVDEGSEVTEDTYNALMSRLRQNSPLAAARRRGVKWDWPRQQMAVVSNPNGHDWLWELFVNRPTPDRRYFMSTSFDNPTLYNPDGTPSAYLLSLLNMPPAWVARFVFCSFDAFEGQIYDWRPQDHVVPYFQPPDHWQRGMGLDWGIRNPTAIGWWAQDPETKVWYKYREWQSYDPSDPVAKATAVTPTVSYVSAIIKKLEGGEKITYRAAGPDLWRKQTGDMSNETIEYHFGKAGIFFTPGAPDYNSRINAVQSHLATDKIRVMTECPMTQIAYQQYRWADLRVESANSDAPEKPRKKDDHLVDADQYFFTLFTQNMAPPTAARPFTWDDHIRRQITKQVGKFTNRAKYGSNVL